MLNLTINYIGIETHPLAFTQKKKQMVSCICDGEAFEIYAKYISAFIEKHQ